MGIHAVSIVGMNAFAPFNRLHDAVARRQSKDPKELRGGVRDLTAKVPDECRDAAGPLRQAQHRRRIPFASLARLALGDGCPQEQRRRREDSQEHLKQDQAVVDFLAGKRANPSDRMPDRHRRRAQDDERCRGQPARRGRADHEREERVFDRMRAHAEELSEHHVRHEQRAGDKHRAPQRQRVATTRIVRSSESRRDDSRAQDVTEPPLEPQCRESRPLLDPSRGQRRHTDGGADRGAEHSCDDEKPDDVDDAAEW